MILVPSFDIDDFVKLHLKTQRIERDIKDDFHKRIKNAADMAARAVRVRAATISLPGIKTSGRVYRHTPDTGLRAKLVAGISSGSSAIGAASVEQSSLGISGRSSRALPRRIDEGGTFSHPVYGHRWKARQLGSPYFMRTIDELRPAMEEEVSRVLDDIDRRLT